MPAQPNEKNTSKVIVIAAEQRPDAWWWLLIGVIALVAWLVLHTPAGVAEGEVPIYRRVFLYVLSGIGVSVLVTISSFVLTVIFGLFGGLGRLSKSKFVHGLTTLYVELVRGIPLMVQLIWWYYAFPAIIKNLGNDLNIGFLTGYRAPAIPMAILGLTFCYGAYMSEIYRAGIQSIPKGQLEAALSLGMTRIQALRFIVIPQAIRVILPPMGNEFIALLKDSSLVSAVAVADLTRRGHEIMSRTYKPIETWVMVALLYLVLTLFSARIVSFLERKMKTETTR
jgi:polar amino acid transport system permease protein